MNILMTLLIAFGQSGQSTFQDFPAQDEPPSFETVGSTLLVLNGQAQGKLTSSTRSTLQNGRRTTFDSFRFRVDTSNRPVSSRQFVLLVPRKDPDIPSYLPVQKKVVVVCCESTGSLLQWPILIDGNIEGYTTYPSLGSNEVLGLAFFETGEGQLPKNSDHTWQFVESIALALRDTTRDNLERIAKYLLAVKPPGMVLSDWTGRKPDRYCKLLSRAVEGQPAYCRALIYYVLNYYRYYGFGDQYLRAVREAASDAGAFPRGVPEPTWWEDPVNDHRVKDWFKHDEFRPAEVVKVIVSSNNPRVSSYLIRTFGGAPELGLQRVLARKLGELDQEAQWILTKKLAQWNEDMAHAPQPRERSETAQGKEIWLYPGLGETVNYWKSRF